MFSCFWSCILSVTSIIACAPKIAVSGGTDTAGSQPGGGKDNVSKHLHPTALHWGQHWPTGGTTPDIEQASVQMVHELRCWVHPGFNFASPGLQDFWFLLFLHVSMFVYSWLLIFWIRLNLIWHQQVILWWVHLKWGGGAKLIKLRRMQVCSLHLDGGSTLSYDQRCSCSSLNPASSLAFSAFFQLNLTFLCTVIKGSTNVGSTYIVVQSWNCVSAFWIVLTLIKAGHDHHHHHLAVLLQCFEIIQGWHNFKIDWLKTN